MRTIRQLREERGWTQLELATRLGVTTATVYNWERRHHEPRGTQLRALASIFDVSMDELDFESQRTTEPRGRKHYKG